MTARPLKPWAFHGLPGAKARRESHRRAMIRRSNRKAWAKNRDKLWWARLRRFLAKLERLPKAHP